MHDVIITERVVEVELGCFIAEAIEKRVSFLEIVFDKNNGELKKRVLRFLAQPKIRKLYHRMEKDGKNFGRIFVHFRLVSNRKKIGLLGVEKARDNRKAEEGVQPLQGWDFLG